MRHDRSEFYLKTEAAGRERELRNFTPLDLGRYLNRALAAAEVQSLMATR